MLRAILKGTLLFGFGRMPGGARLYRELTRNRMGTQSTHVDKLKRVWPGYVAVWQSRCGLEMAGLDVWVHEGGWTPFPLLVNYLLTGKGGIVTNREGRVLDRYLAHAVNSALTIEFPTCTIDQECRRRVEPLRWLSSVEEALAAIGGRALHEPDPGALSLATNSIDLCHSGGQLEHYRPETLAAFLSECYRILRPGGIASHVFDHRDHLYHADKRMPYMAHLALPQPLYRALCGHPLGYHNRLLPEQVMAQFAAAGFEPIAVRRMLLPDNSYVEGAAALAGRPGLPRPLLARRFRNTSEIDLRTAAAHYLYRKPIDNM